MPIFKPGPRQIAYCLEGPPLAPVIVLSNSLGTTMSMWEAQARALAGEYRILRYDTRGHGGSGTGPDAAGGYTLDELGGDVVQLLDALEIEQVHFCGISMGGLIGLWLGVHAGRRLQSLVVANSAARIGTSAAWRDRAGQVAAAGMDGVAGSALTRWFTDGFVQRSPEVTTKLIDQLRRCPPAGYAACCEALARADLREAISAISIPTMLLAGRFDAVTTVADAEFMCGQIKGSTIRVMDASHLSNIEAAAQFTSELRAFLN